MLLVHVLLRFRRGLQVRQVREGVCLQVLQGQAPQVHTLRGPGRPEVPLPPVQQVLREEGPAADPHPARSRKAQAPQGDGSAHNQQVNFIFISCYFVLFYSFFFFRVCHLQSEHGIIARDNLRARPRGAERTAPCCATSLRMFLLYRPHKKNKLGQELWFGGDRRATEAWKRP